MIVAVGVVYRVVPNTKVPLQVLWLPTLAAGLVLTVLTELLVYIAPLLTGSLSVFGGVAAVFAALGVAASRVPGAADRRLVDAAPPRRSLRATRGSRVALGSGARLMHAA